MALMIAVTVRKQVPDPRRPGKTKQALETKQVDRAKLQRKLGPEKFKRFLDGETFKVGNYVMEVS